MTPTEIKKLYEYLCPECRYDWVYENSNKPCDTCSAKAISITRFNKDIRSRLIYQYDYYDDYVNNVFHLEIHSNFTPSFEKGKALILIVKEPFSTRRFSDVLTTTDFIFGNFFTPKRFIGTSLPRFDPIGRLVYAVTR